MAAEIFLSVPDAQSMAQDVRRTSQDMTSQINALAGRMKSLTDSFRGETQRKWAATHDKLTKETQQVLEILDDLGRFLDSAAKGIQETDTNMASQLPG